MNLFVHNNTFLRYLEEGKIRWQAEREREERRRKEERREREERGRMGREGDGMGENDDASSGGSGGATALWWKRW